MTLGSESSGSFNQMVVGSNPTIREDVAQSGRAFGPNHRSDMFSEHLTQVSGQ